MKIALPVANKEGEMSRAFGRAAYFAIVDGSEITYIDNTQNLNAVQGAGIQSAQHIVDAGAEALLTPHCGPKAFKVLSAAGVKIYSTDAATVGEAVARFIRGELKEITAPDVAGHWQ
jgi:predicted Fe-Mo cluster-binding NifX family protein